MKNLATTVLKLQTKLSKFEWYEMNAETLIESNKKLQSQLDIANNKIKEVNAKLKDLLEGNTYELPRKCCYARLKEIDSIIGGE